MTNDDDDRMNVRAPELVEIAAFPATVNADGTPAVVLCTTSDNGDVNVFSLCHGTATQLVEALTIAIESATDAAIERINKESA